MRPERRGKVQLIDGTSFWTKMRKNLGNKSREIDAAARDNILALYDAFDDATPDYSKIFANTDFGYWTITVTSGVHDPEGAPHVLVAPASLEPVPVRPAQSVS